MNWRRRKKTWYACLIIFEAFIGSYIYIIQNDIPFWPLNPPQRPWGVTILLSYPDAVGVERERTGVFVGYNLDANSSNLAEDTNVSIDDPMGVIYSTHYAEVLYVASGFLETFPNSKCNEAGGVEFVGGGFAGVIFGHFDKGTNGLTAICKSSFKWLVSGDYSPVMVIEFNNGSTVEWRYDEIKVHVASPIEIQSLKTGSIELALTYALLGFAFLEGFAIIRDFVADDENSSKIVRISTPSPKDRRPMPTDPTLKRKRQEKSHRSKG